MNTSAFVAVFGSVILAVLVRVSNMVCTWLSRLLGVNPPDPIQVPGEATVSRPGTRTGPAAPERAAGPDGEP